MQDDTSAAAKAATLTIHFLGLCLFAKAPDEDVIHVFLGQPQHLPHSGTHHDAQHPVAHDMTHLPTLCTKKDGIWSAQRIDTGCTLEFGVKGAKVEMMPSEDDMTNLTSLLGGGGLPRSEAKPDTPAKGPHVHLFGGRLSVTPWKEIGIWDAALSSGTREVNFPYMLTWTAPAGSKAGEMQIWNATEKESPTLDVPTEFPTKRPTDDEAAKLATAHFATYFHILKTAAPKIKYKGIWKPAGAMSLTAQITTIIVSSCPSALTDLS